MELNAETVKEWLEICAEDTPYPDQSQALLDALALITSQEQRIKELTEEAESLKQAMEHEHASFMETFGEYGEKCERLTEENERLRKSRSILAPIRGFTADEIDQIAKEMLEGENEN